ncbi:hypothetical protein NP493_230g00000 [Ridgeia piscesae]|uniref:Uncharacterized protein n=1 Tax=Ridgeia piscesae TaxID=27915 RepID=A0AAD9P043_RIDPI|nr:hypothetical protein NP493_230g00000 [Ridgeia piscesae]
MNTYTSAMKLYKYAAIFCNMLSVCSGKHIFNNMFQ